MREPLFMPDQKNGRSFHRSGRFRNLHSHLESRWGSTRRYDRLFSADLARQHQTSHRILRLEGRTNEYIALEMI